MADYKLGDDGVFYYSTTALTSLAGSVAGLEAALPFNQIRDVTSSITKDKIALQSRAGGRWKRSVGGKKDMSITFKIEYKPGDPDYEAFRDSFMHDTVLACWVLSSDKDDELADGAAGNFEVTTFTRSEPGGGAMEVDVELAPHSFQHWYPDTES